MTGHRVQRRILTGLEEEVSVKKDTSYRPTLGSKIIAILDNLRSQSWPSDVVHLINSLMDLINAVPCRRTNDRGCSSFG